MVGVVARGTKPLADLVAAAHGTAGAVLPLAVDYLDLPSLLSVLDGAGGYRKAILYLPLAEPATIGTLVGRTAERAVVLRTTSAAAPRALPWNPGSTASGAAAAVLQLGWRIDAAGSGEWHGPGEISAAACELLRSTADRLTLGAIEPWSSRPGR